MRPQLSLCMIVRNEAAMLPHCLESVAGVVDEVVVVDTGSTDGTPDLAADRGARVYHHPWTGDFATARNLSLEQARGDWILVLDADEALHPADRDQVPGLLLNGNVESYLSTQINYLGANPGEEATHSYTQRLFRNRPQYRYHGRIHERMELPQSHTRVAPFRILHYGYLQQVVSQREKRRRNLELLEQVLAESPEDALLRFTLGNEYLAAGQETEAVAAYRAAKEPALKAGYLFAGMLMKHLAGSLLNLRQPEAALTELAEGLTHFPDFTDLVYLQGMAYRTLSRLPEAIGSFHQCLAMGPSPVPPHVGVDPAMGGWKAMHALGDAHALRGETEKAAGFYRRAWCIGHNPLTLGSLARLLLINGGPEQAEAGLQSLVQPADAGSHLLLAEALAKGRHWRGALRHAGMAATQPHAAQAAGLHPPALLPDPQAQQERRLQEVGALCRYHLGDMEGASGAFAGLPAEVCAEERLVAGLATGELRPVTVVAGRRAGEACSGLLSAAISSLEQGLCRQPESLVLQSALERAIREVRRLG